MKRGIQQKVTAVFYVGAALTAIRGVRTDNRGQGAPTVLPQQTRYVFFAAECWNAIL